MTQKATQVELMVYARLSFAHLHKPKEGTNSQGKATQTYCVHAQISESDVPDSPLDPRVAYGAGALKAIKDAQQTVAAAAWAQKDAVLAQLAHQDKLVLHDGNMSKSQYPEYKDKFYVSCNGKNRPTLVETRGGKNVQLVESDNRPYSGCWAVVHFAIWAQDPDGKSSGFGKRMNAQLMGVQFIKHDAAFGGGGRVSSADEFGVSASEADAAMPAAAAGGRSLF